MISLAAILAALVLLTLWDSAEAEDHRQALPAENDPRTLRR